MPKAVPIISAFHNLSAGDLADEHGQLCAQIADLETRKRTIAGELIRRGVSGGRRRLVPQPRGGRDDVSTLDRQGIEKAMGEAWIAPFLKFSKRSAFVKTTARHRRRPDGSVRDGRSDGYQISEDGRSARRRNLPSHRATVLHALRRCSASCGISWR